MKSYQNTHFALLLWNYVKWTNGKLLMLITGFLIKLTKNQRLHKKNNFVNEMYENMSQRPKSELIKVLMFSDLHVDYDY